MFKKESRINLLIMLLSPFILIIAGVWQFRKIKISAKNPKKTEFLPGIPIRRGKTFIKDSEGTEFLPGIPVRKNELGAKYSEAQMRLFVPALESYLSKDYEHALILLRRLYKSEPDHERIKDLYYKSLVELAIVHEEKQDYTIALDYIKEAEKIANTQQLKEIKKRILGKAKSDVR